jgi:hypothetical protein
MVVRCQQVMDQLEGQQRIAELQWDVEPQHLQPLLESTAAGGLRAKG